MRFLPYQFFPLSPYHQPAYKEEIQPAENSSGIHLCLYIIMTCREKHVLRPGCSNTRDKTGYASKPASAHDCMSSRFLMPFQDVHDWHGTPVCYEHQLPDSIARDGNQYWKVLFRNTGLCPEPILRN